jgi:hypothetical protein
VPIVKVEGIRVYVLAPPPFIVVVAPLHITELVALAVITGNGFTVTLTNALFVLVHPVTVLVPVTEYEFVVVGEKATPFTTVPVHT